MSYLTIKGAEKHENALQEMSYEELKDLYEDVMERYEQALATGDVRTADAKKKLRDELEDLISGFEE